MIRDRGSWLFDDVYDGGHRDSYPGIRDSLRILMTSLFSSKILVPNILGRDIPLRYDTVEELLDQIEASGYLDSTAEFDIRGETVIYIPQGEEVYQNIISIERFRITEPFFQFVVRTDHWFPMMTDSEMLKSSWNLERYHLNYHRIPALLKKLDQELDWKNEELLFTEEWYLSVQAGYDLFMEESVIARAYKKNPNPAFDLDAYLAAIKRAREQYYR